MALINKAIFTVLAVGLAVVPAVRSQEKRITKGDLPAAVQKTIAEQSKGATIKGYAKEVEGGKTYYEVEMEINGHSKDILMDGDGAIVEVEEEVALNSLSPAVREGLAKAAGEGKIMKVESLTKHGKLVAYEAVVQTGTKKSEIQVGPDGKSLIHKE
jgi:uncharacterized cupredoxin-like copper-binding protein